MSTLAPAATSHVTDRGSVTPERSPSLHHHQQQQLLLLLLLLLKMMTSFS
jgi:hypothetical protein